MVYRRMMASIVFLQCYRVRLFMENMRQMNTGHRKMASVFGWNGWLDHMIPFCGLQYG